MRLEGDPIEAELRAVDANRVSFAGANPFALPLEELVRWGHLREPRGRILVVLADGGRLVTAAAWGGGAAVRLEGEQVVVLTDTWGEVPLERGLVRGFVFSQQSHAREREQLEEVVRGSDLPPDGADSPADVVLLSNTDHVTGAVTGITGGSLTLQMDVQSVKLPLSRVEAVVLAQREPSGGSPEAQSKAAEPSRHPSPEGRGSLNGPSLKRRGNLADSSPRGKGNLVVGLRDGSLVYAASVVGDENALLVTLPSGVALKGGNVNDVSLLQSLGGRFIYLSDLEPSGYRHVPYLTIEWPYRSDRNVLGEPLSVNGKRYLKGIGMHSAARLSYRLEGTYRRFESMVAVDDSAGTKGSVTFGVYVLRESQWREAFLSGVIRGGDARQPVSVDVSGAEGLTLTVDYADRGDELDHADWLDARLIIKED